MPRIGINPNRGKLTNYQPARITLAMLTYLPNQAGYFAERMAVTRLSLESLLAHTPQPRDVLVFDNGSCRELVNYLCQLRDEDKINYLILSNENIGKISALQVIFRAAPGDLVAYSDDDIFFLPGWLDAHVSIIDTYPRAGLVTGFYIRSHLRYATQTIEAFTQQAGVQVKRGMLIPHELEQHYIDNMGRNWEAYQQEVSGLEDILLTYQGIEAMASAGHHQFLAPRQLMLNVLPGWDKNLMGKMIDLENEVDRLGYLRLSTPTPVTRLLGNVISDENATEARRLGLLAQAGKTSKGDHRMITRLMKIQLIKRLIMGVYNRLHVLVNI
ncbi:MAG TPA: glycosyltransferase family A protein [Anaerolineales bacterium]|nr:glycosyltransferase family A protein [Anaerolineales bacterium]